MVIAQIEKTYFPLSTQALIRLSVLQVAFQSVTVEPALQGLISQVMFRLVSCLGSLWLEPWHTHMSPPLTPWRRSGLR